jgi:L-alanine-DL-glutamate epimerase-like enolase superfamily enzyme
MTNQLTPSPAVLDRITGVKLSSVTLPLPTGISDAKVLTGRQKPMTEVAVLFAEISTEAGLEGIGIGYSKRAGGPGQFAHAREIAPVLLGEDPSDIAKIWDKLMWAGASVGRSGLSVQAIAAFDVALWDIKAKRAGLPLAKLLGAHRDSVRCYNTSGGFLHAPIEEVLERAGESLASGIGGIKIKVGHPDTTVDIARVTAVREKIGDAVPLMVAANQQWDRPDARRMCRAFEPLHLVWIEEPLDAYDFAGHAQLARTFDTSIATGEMLTSVAEHAELIRAGIDIVQPGRAARRRYHPVPGRDGAGRARTSAAGTPFRDGGTYPPSRGLPTRAVGGTLRMVRPVVRRTPRDPRRAHAPVGTSRLGRDDQRAGPGVDRRRVRDPRLNAADRHHDWWRTP